MINEKTISILPTPEKIKCTVIGCGAVGSKVINELVRLGVNEFTLWDYDTIEEHNVGNQIFVPADIGKKKAVVCRDLIRSINPGAVINMFDKKFTSLDSIDTQYLVVSVDSMKARKDIFSVIQTNKDLLGMNTRVVDTRIATYEVSLYSFTTESPNSVTSYQRSLYDDAKVAPEIQSPCGTVQGLGTISSLAAIMAVTKIIHAEKSFAKYGEDIMNLEKGFDVVSYTK